MKRFTVFFIAMILVTLTAAPTLAQDTTAFRALQFGIGQDFMLKKFEGRSLGYEHKINDVLSIRLALSLHAINFDYDSEGDYGNLETYPDSVWVHSYSDQSNSDKNQDYSIAVYLIHHIETSATVRAYWGTGPTIGKMKSIVETDEILDRHISADIRNSDSDFYSSHYVGLAGVFGAQWHFHDRISLQLEYWGEFRMHANARENKDKQWRDGVKQSDDASGQNGSGWSLGSGTRFGLAFHF